MIQIKNRWTGAVIKEVEAADLREANLREADLREADLREANLREANLRGADLRGADLRGANLTWADLRGADLTRADLTWADLREADLRGAGLTRAALPYAPVIENLDSKILSVIGSGGKLEMESWHTCETAHCRAGWAITLAGEAGKVLESVFGPATAGALIYAHSKPGQLIPNFYASNDEALASIKAGAEQEAKTALEKGQP